MTLKKFNVKSGLSVGTAQITDVIDANANAHFNALTVDTQTNLGAVANVHIDGGSANYVLSTDGLGNLSWAQPPSSTAIINGNSNVTVSANGNVTTSVAGTANVLTVSANGIAVVGKSQLGELGNVVIDGGTANYLLQTDGAGNLTWVAPPSATSIVNGTSNVVVALDGVVTTSVGGNANILTVTGTGANVTGDITVTGISTLGNLGNVKITGGVSSQILATDGTGNLTWVDQPIGVVPTIDEFVGTGTTATYTLSATPVSEDYITVVIDGVTQLHNTYSLSGNVLTLGGTLPTSAAMEVTILSGGSKLQVEVGNGNSTVSAPTLNGNILITADTATWTFDTTGNLTLPSNTSLIKYANGTPWGPTTAETVTANAQPNITSVGTLTTLAVTGNLTAGNLTTTGDLTATNANLSGNITVAGNVSNLDVLSFDTSNGTGTLTTGQMSWDVTERSMSIGMLNGAILQIGLEFYLPVKASTAITNGQPVMFTGANGDNITAAPADTTSAGFKSEYIIGVATQDIALNAFGYITVMGCVHGLNTNAFNQGDILWVDTTTPGTLTNVQPTDPNFQIQMAAVTKKSAGDGHIQVRVTAYWALSKLTDVTITSPTSGQALVLNGSNIWINGTPQSANTAATVTTNAQPNITSVGTLTTLAVSGNANVGNLGAASGVFTANVTAANLSASSFVIRSVDASIAAAGTTQGAATTLTKEINMVTTVTTPANGVALPAATPGMIVTIRNASANTMTVYPASGSTINSLATDTAFQHPAGATLQFMAPTATQWYTIGATFA